MIVTLLVLGAVLLSILGIVALSITPRRMFALDDGSIHTPAQLDAAMLIQRSMHIAELQRRMTDTNYLSYALLGLAFLNVRRDQHCRVNPSCPGRTRDPNIEYRRSISHQCCRDRENDSRAYEL